MNLERSLQRGQSVEWPKAVAAGAALVVALYALSIPGIYPRWELWTTVVILGLGLAGRPLLRLGGGWRKRSRLPYRSVQTLAACVAIGVLIFAPLREQLDTDYWWPPAVLTAILAIGLAADPIDRLAAGRRVGSSANAVAALAAVTVIAYALSSDRYERPQWPLWITAAILGLGFLAGRFAQLTGREAAQESTQTVAAAAATGLLIVALIFAGDLVPAWSFLMLTGILVLGLVAGPLAQRLTGSRQGVLSQRVAELSRTRSGALDVQASELRRIERDLHDGAQARLVALSMKLGRAEDRYQDDAAVSALLREAREDTTAAIRDLRELARGITPPVLADRGLEAAVRSLAQRSGTEVSVTSTLSRRPEPAVETAAYFVVAESLTNAAKHAPGALVEIRLDEHGGDLFVEITDFGSGGADWFGGGLTGLRQRVEALDGTLRLTSPAGVGTQVEAMLPCGW
jgi:signal transduction histidine kinase